MIPFATVLITVVALVVINPPFVCGKDGASSMAKLFAWGAIAGVATAALTAQGAFAGMCAP